ncbi:peptidase [Arthrobacter sp. FW306-04-A]|uniref:peptidase n=1 Tax=Arthrobacter sp. FW306-04-A TaxID=2879619 RepID=UPI0037C0F1A1|nr:peptidase [Arthrobacter sp. FW306-04-A]
MSRQPAMVGLTAVVVQIPGHGSFTVTAEAAMMIKVFGGTLHCYQGSGGCRKQGLYFSRTEPKKYLKCLVTGPPGQESTTGQDDAQDVALSVSRDLAPKLDGAVLHFGNYNKMERFVWLSMPAVTGHPCVCRRSIGAPAGKCSPCLDDSGVGLSDI